MAESFQRVSAFGEKVIANHNVFAEKEDVSFTPEEIEAVFKHFHEEKNNEKFVAGFVSCFADFLLANWEKIDSDAQNKYKNEILEISKSSNFSLNFGIRFAHFVSNVFVKSGNNWDDLLKLIFETKEIESFDLLSLLFIYTYGTFSESYITENKAKIASRVVELLEKSSNSVQIRLMNVLVCLEKVELDDAQLEQLWKVIFKVTYEKPDTEIVINSILTGIFGDYLAIQKQKKPVIDSNEKLEAALRLLFVYTPEQTIEILIAYIEKYNEKLVSALNGDFIDTVQPDQLKAIEEFMLKSEGDDKVKKYVALAPLIPYINNIDKEFSGKVVEVLRWTSENDQESFLRILKYASACIFKGVRLPFVTTQLMKILENDDEKGQLAAEVAKQCFKNGLLKTRPDMKGVLNKFAAVHQNHKAKLINAIDALVNNDEFDAYLITPLSDFIRTQLQLTTQAEDVRAACFTLISSIAVRDENIPFSMKKEIINLIPVLIDGQDSSKAAGTHMLYFFAEMGPDFVQKILPPSLEKLFEFAFSSQAATELRGSVGESLAGIVSGLFGKKYIPKLVDLIKLFLESGDRNLGISGSTMAIIANGALDAKEAEEVFLACARAAVATDYAPLFNSYVEGMRRLFGKIKNYQPALDFAMEVLCGFAKVAELEPVSSWYNLRTPLYAVFTAIIESLKEKAAPLFQYFVEILSDCVDAMVDVVFQPIAKLFELDLIGEETKKAVVSITSERCLTARSIQLLDFTNAHLTDATKFVEKASACYEELCNKEESDVDEDNDDDIWKSCLGVVLLQLNGKGVELSENIIEDAILDFPPDASLEKSEDMAKEIVRIATRETNTDDLKSICAKVIFDFLLLGKPELTAHKVKDATVTELTNAIKGIIKSSKEIEKEMQKYCGGVRAKINKLNKLTK